MLYPDLRFTACCAHVAGMAALAGAATGMRMGAAGQPIAAPHLNVGSVAMFQVRKWVCMHVYVVLYLMTTRVVVVGDDNDADGNDVVVDCDDDWCWMVIA